MEYYRGTMWNYYVPDGTTLIHPNAPYYETTEKTHCIFLQSILPYVTVGSWEKMKYLIFPLFNGEGFKLTQFSMGTLIKVLFIHL